MCRIWESAVFYEKIRYKLCVNCKQSGWRCRRVCLPLRLCLRFSSAFFRVSVAAYLYFFGYLRPWLAPPGLRCMSGACGAGGICRKNAHAEKKCSVGNFCRCAVSYSVPWQSAALRGCLLMLRWPGHVDCWFRYVPQSDWQRFGDGYRKSGGIKTCRIFLWFLGYCVRHFGFRMPFISITAEWPPYRRQAWLVAIWCWR